MRKIHILILMTAALMLSVPVSAATVLHYDCDTDMNGNPGVPGARINTGTSAAAGIPDLSGNGYDMWGWASSTANNSPAFSPAGETPNDTGLSADFVGGNWDGYTGSGGGTINTWSPETWTIECAVKFTNVDAWYTMIGRSGASSGGSEADFYLQKNDIADQFRINFLSVGGTRYILDAGENFVVQPNQWYRVAVTSDGTTLSMYIDDTSGSGYQLANSLTMTGATPAANAPIATGNFVWTFGRGWFNGNGDFVPGYLDDIRFSDVALQPTQFLGANLGAYDPDPTPFNGDGSVGTLNGSQADVTLNFKAGKDPNSVREYPVNPEIVTHYVRIGTDAEALAVHGFVDQVHNADPSLTDPANAYGPVTLSGGTVYYWQVEEGLDDGTGDAYPAGDPNNIMGPVWSFTTVAATPTVTDPVNAVADENGLATLSVTPSASADSFQWFKVGTPDVPLSDAGIYSGTTTPTLTITGMTLADEAQYYIIAYNGLTPSEPSASAWVWTQRLMHHYPFEEIYFADGNSLTPDIVGGYDAVLMQEGTAGLPVLSDANQLELGLPGSSYALLLDNGDHAADPNGQYAQIPAGILAFQDVTISAWFQVKEYGVFARIFDFGNGTTDYLTFIPDNGNYDMRYSTRLNNGGPQNLLVDYDASNFIAAGSWNQVVLTLSGDTGRLYRNGELVLTGPITIDPIDIGAVVNYIGKSQYVADPEFSGLIDDLKIYNYARSTEQIAQDYVDVAGGWVCNNELADLLYDFNDDCRVNLADFAFIAAEWLGCQRIPDTLCGN